jgi:hypothetical protein
MVKREKWKEKAGEEQKETANEITTERKKDENNKRAKQEETSRNKETNEPYKEYKINQIQVYYLGTVDWLIDNYSGTQAGVFVALHLSNSYPDLTMISPGKAKTGHFFPDLCLITIRTFQSRISTSIRFKTNR